MFFKQSPLPVPIDFIGMHRTDSLDYGIVLEGEVECLLGSGESEIMKRGDVTVQRGIAHSWINRSRPNGPGWYMY